MRNIGKQPRPDLLFHVQETQGDMHSIEHLLSLSQRHFQEMRSIQCQPREDYTILHHSQKMQDHMEIYRPNLGIRAEHIEKDPPQTERIASRKRGRRRLSPKNDPTLNGHGELLQPEPNQ
jgi:hypothetical protein